jgi:tetratricopeptide (TPR) repeat protein
MPFSRIQGNKLLILHSSRIDGKVKQIRLHSFDTFADAKETVDSNIKWDLLCETLKIQFGVNINKKKLRESTANKLKEIEFDEIDPTNSSVLRVLGFLKNCRPPLSPKQIKVLKKAENNLIALKDILDEKLKLLEGPVKSFIRNGENEAEQYLDLGLDYYGQGEWDEAKQLFLKGLKIEPDHVDLIVHAGLIELIHQEYFLALNYFNNAMEIGRQFADLMIETEPDEYIKDIDLDKWSENKVCDLADECPDRFTSRCNGCEESPKFQKTELYRYLEFRPFFRAMTNKAITLMKLKRYEDAINTLKICQEYQPLWGTYNMIGVCYLSLGNFYEADKWYREFLWNDTYYIKALIDYFLDKTEDALKYLLPGIIKNQYIAKMLAGKEKPEEIRYLGSALPDRLKASEFIHEHGYLFKQNPDFRNLINCILEFDEISVLLDSLVIEIDKTKANRNYKMDKQTWNLLHGDISDDFINKYIPIFMNRLNDKNKEYWKPKTEDVLDIQIIEKKQQNWLVKLMDFEKLFYFRPKIYIEDVGNDDCIQISVTKSWFYRKRVFVSGEIIQ